jgi:hypothetical protein
MNLCLQIQSQAKKEIHTFWLYILPTDGINTQSQADCRRYKSLLSIIQSFPTPLMRHKNERTSHNICCNIIIKKNQIINFYRP